MPHAALGVEGGAIMNPQFTEAKSKVQRGEVTPQSHTAATQLEPRLRGPEPMRGRKPLSKGGRMGCAPRCRPLGWVGELLRPLLGLACGWGPGARKVLSMILRG